MLSNVQPSLILRAACMQRQKSVFTSYYTFTWHQKRIKGHYTRILGPPPPNYRLTAYCIACLSNAVLRDVGRQMERGCPGEGVVTTDPLGSLCSFWAHLLTSYSVQRVIPPSTPLPQMIQCLTQHSLSLIYLLKRMAWFVNSWHCVELCLRMWISKKNITITCLFLSSSWYLGPCGYPGEPSCAEKRHIIKRYAHPKRRNSARVRRP